MTAASRRDEMSDSKWAQSAVSQWAPRPLIIDVDGLVEETAHAAV